MKFRPGKRVDFEHVVEEFNQFVGVLPDMYDFVRLLDRVVVAANLLDAASGGPNDIFKVAKILYEEALGGRGIAFIPAIRHRLPTTSLIEREMDLQPKFLKELKCGNSDLWIDHVDIAGNEETNAQFSASSGSVLFCFDGSRHVCSPFKGGRFTPQ